MENRSRNHLLSSEAASFPFKMTYIAKLAWKSCLQDMDEAPDGGDCCAQLAPPTLRVQTLVTPAAKLFDCHPC